MKKQFIKWAKDNDWDIVEVEDKADLPDHIIERYIIPDEWYEFVAKLRVCQNKDYTKWFITPLDYKNDRNEGFRWNEYELQSLNGVMVILRLLNIGIHICLYLCLLRVSIPTMP